MSDRTSHWALRTTSDERALLAAVLEFQRETIVVKLTGLSDEEAARSGAPSGTSLAGLVKHLAEVERWWFQAVMAGRDIPLTEGDADWVIEPGETPAELVDRYREAWAESNAIAEAAGSLDDLSADLHAEHVDGAVSLRWIYLHMIEETARHAGHADILREQIDGATGY